MNVRLEELYGIIRSYTQVGFMEAIRAYDPLQDKLRASEIKKWLKINHIPYKEFQGLVKRGIVVGFKQGKGKNSPLLFSKREIKEAIATAQLYKIIANNELNNIK